MARLYIIPTPIGNLSDITQRALDTIRSVDFLLAEDTRVTGKLLKLYSLKKEMVPFHQHNEHRLLDNILDRISSAGSVGLVSDAGTPGISDPGFLLVRACIESGIEVECLPGAVAFVPALIESGFPCDRFVFEGFLPHKKGRMKRLEALKDETRTILFYESPYRLLKLLEQAGEVFGDDRPASVSREISKLYGETVRGSLGSLKAHFAEKGVKGEFVVVVSGGSAS